MIIDWKGHTEPTAVTLGEREREKPKGISEEVASTVEVLPFLEPTANSGRQTKGSVTSKLARLRTAGSQGLIAMPS